MRTRVFGVLTLVMVLGLLPAGPAASSPGTGDDCGGPDTPPAYVLTSGVSCDGSLDEPASSTTDIAAMGYRESRFIDRFEIPATDGDRVDVSATNRVCFTVEPLGTFVAEGNGNITITVTARQTFELGTSTPKNPCPDTPPASYTIRAAVTPNDRPSSVSASGVPVSAAPGDSYTFTVSGTDPDGNLKALGVGWSPTNIDWKQQLLGSSSWSTDFSYYLWDDTQFKVYARDTFGAVKESSASYLIRLQQDDCGFGRDANMESVTIPFTCNEAFFAGSEADSFTFTVPAGRRPYAFLDNGEDWGQLLALTSPSGVEMATGSEEIFGTAEAGTWTLAVQGDGDKHFYKLTISTTGPQAAPSLTVSADSTAHQGDLFPVKMRGVDPNAQRLEYLIEWSDGSGSWWPTNSTAASGETVTGYRYLLSDATVLSATVRAVNREGFMSPPVNIQVTIRPHNDCGIAPRYDLPSTASGSIPNPCAGTLGGGQLEDLSSTDDRDAFIPANRCTVGSCKLRITLTTEAGLSAYLVAETLPGVVQSSTACGSGGCTETMDLLITYPTSSYPRITIARASGKGGYTVSLERVALTNGLL